MLAFEVPGGLWLLVNGVPPYPEGQSGDEVDRAFNGERTPRSPAFLDKHLERTELFCLRREIV